MTDASQLRAVRAGFAFTQAGLAPWLGLSRGLLALVETGREQLPAHARPWLRPWVAALAATTEATEPAAPTETPLLAEPPPTCPAAVLARLAECRYQAQRLGRQLAALRTVQHTAARRLAAGPLLQAALPPHAEAEAEALGRRRRWLARLLEEATDAQAPEAPAGPVAAALLAARQRAWQHEAACLRAWLVGEV